MRWFAVALLSAALAAPASATSVDPKLFALRQADVPSGYLFDRDNSVLLSKAIVDRASNDESRFLRRLGFQGAYFATYLNTSPPKWRFVHSGAYVFRTTAGARAFVRSARRYGFTPFGRPGRPLALGDEAWFYGDTKDESAVTWRQGRVAAYAACSEMADHRALVLALARKQQRRIVALTR